MSSENLDKTIFDTDEQIDQNLPVTSIEKPKRTLTEKQKQALEAGRQRRKQRLQESAKIPEQQQIPEVHETNTEVHEEPVKKTLNLEKPKKPRVQSPECQMDIAKSSLRNHMQRFPKKQEQPAQKSAPQQDPEPKKPQTFRDVDIQKWKQGYNDDNSLFIKKIKNSIFI